MAQNMESITRQIEELRRDYKIALGKDNPFGGLSAAIKLGKVDELDDAIKDVRTQLVAAKEIAANKVENGHTMAREAAFIAIEIVENVKPLLEQYSDPKQNVSNVPKDVIGDLQKAAEDATLQISGRKDFPQRIVAAKLYDEVNQLNKAPERAEEDLAMQRFDESGRNIDQPVKSGGKPIQLKPDMSAGELSAGLAAPMSEPPHLKFMGRGSRESEVLRELEGKAVPTSASAAATSDPKAQGIPRIDQRANPALGQC